MKDYILNTLEMKDVLYRYGIKTNKDMFSCPFHGKDRKPSAKAYKNSFHCFACGITKDTIGFIEEYFNLSFKEAMQKLNEDFGLGLDFKTRIDYDKINRIKREREEKERYKKILMQDFSMLCNKKIMLERLIKFTNEHINIYNIDDMLKTQNQLRDAQWNVEIKIDELEKKMAII